MSQAQTLSLSSPSTSITQELKLEGLFWLHAWTILGGIIMGAVLPLHLAVAAILAHRLQFVVLGDCILSIIQKKNGDLLDQTYLQSASERLFGLKLSKIGHRLTDLTLGTLSLSVAVSAQIITQASVLQAITLLLLSLIIHQNLRLLRFKSKKSNTPELTCDQTCTLSANNFSRSLPLPQLGLFYFSTLFVLVLTNSPLLNLSLAVGISISLSLIAHQIKTRTLCTYCLNIHGLSLFTSTLLLLSS